jgi:hypothetical protein
LEAHFFGLIESAQLESVFKLLFYPLAQVHKSRSNSHDRNCYFVLSDFMRILSMLKHLKGKNPLQNMPL